MKKIIIFLAVIVVLTKGSSAQKKDQLSLAEQEQLIAFLIKKREIYDTITNWNHYLDAVYYREIFKNTLKQQNEEIFIFSSKSAHASYFLLLKEDSKLQILASNCLNDDMDVLLDFFEKNVAVNSKKLLKAFSEINKAYLHNQNNNQKIPISQ